MGYSKHTIVLTDIQCLVVLNALNMLIEDPEKHEDDKHIASNTRLLIYDSVKLDKESKNVRD